MSDWISTAERLPETAPIEASGGDCREASGLIAMYWPPFHPSLEPECEAGYFTRTTFASGAVFIEWRYSHCEEYPIAGDPTHWMPLPPLPHAD